MNPIRKINGANFPYIPSSFQWIQEDISASDAGRTEDTVMHKKMLRSVVALELGWQNVKTSVASGVLRAFDREYLTVEYLDPKVGGYTTKTFYVGNRTVPMYSEVLDVWSNISFKIIEV